MHYPCSAAASCSGAARRALPCPARHAARSRLPHPRPLFLSLPPWPQGYLDARTTEELLQFDLPAVVAAVRSFAVGGARAPRCAVVDGPTPASAGGDPAAADELVAWRGVTRESGRQQAWVSLLYAALE